MGTCAWLTEALNVDAMGAASSVADSFRSQFGIELQEIWIS